MGEILSYGTWETGINQILGDILMNRTNSDIDIGANLGIHGLYVAFLYGCCQFQIMKRMKFEKALLEKKLVDVTKEFITYRLNTTEDIHFLYVASSKSFIENALKVKKSNFDSCNEGENIKKSKSMIKSTEIQL